MTFTQRGAVLTAVASTGLAIAAPTMAAAAPASSARGMAHRAKGCIAVTATIRVGRAPEAVAADPKTKTIYAANELDGTASVISARTNTVTATIPVGSSPRAVAADPKTK